MKVLEFPPKLPEVLTKKTHKVTSIFVVDFQKKELLSYWEFLNYDTENYPTDREWEDLITAPDLSNVVVIKFPK
ncbi:MAG: hypothetical protein MOGMAGMI_00381 [Candidatus Omnitrophica bacterium]|nr:hypothetical protein [Candidatus Omnitrophota bacterium]